MTTQKEFEAINRVPQITTTRPWSHEEARLIDLNRKSLRQRKSSACWTTRLSPTSGSNTVGLYSDINLSAYPPRAWKIIVHVRSAGTVHPVYEYKVRDYRSEFAYKPGHRSVTATLDVSQGIIWIWLFSSLHEMETEHWMQLGSVSILKSMAANDLRRPPVCSTTLNVMERRSDWTS